MSELRTATDQDLAEIRELLESAGLPTSDLASAKPRFTVVREDGELERVARSADTERLILLTETAREFFASQGYCVIERSDAPREVQGSEEFRALCPASATCMMKVVTNSE